MVGRGGGIMMWTSGIFVVAMGCGAIILIQPRGMGMLFALPMSLLLLLLLQ